MSKLSRDEQLVRAGKAREAVMGFLRRHPFPTPVTQDEIIVGASLEPLGYTTTELGNFLYRMAHDGLIEKHDVEHPHYKVGYTSKPAAPEAAAPRKYVKKTAVEGAPIDVRVNEREGIITIRYAGMVISLSKE